MNVVRKLKRISGVLLVCAVAWAPWAGGESPASPNVPDLIAIEIEAPEELTRAAVRLRGWQDQRLASFARLIGLDARSHDLPLSIRAVLAPEEKAADLGAPEWVAGYARGDAGVVVLFPARVPVYPDRSLEELLGHEVAHILVFRAAGGRPLPRWFHEGLSMLAEEAWGLEDRSRVALALLRHGRSSLDQLEGRFNQPGQVARSYALAGAFVRELVGREGREFPASLLARVSAGEDFEAAFATVTGTTLEEAESSFWRRLTFWYRWLPFLTSSTTLWMGIMFLALVAIRRRRQRDRALEERWALEEASEAERLREPERLGGDQIDDERLGPVN
ncbi:MAG: hypothetical protein ACE5GX_17460 [Thermoanaerobaculia bacterium]